MLIALQFLVSGGLLCMLITPTGSNHDGFKGLTGLDCKLKEGVKGKHNIRQSLQPGTEVLSTLREPSMWPGVPASRACDTKYPPAQSAFEAHLAGGRR